jgi:hypothetical protein
MDEILIEEKKFISSKRAAKVTGYAKDYIGQLCREGRVPARLVGRSWYVLESAIQDHKFGDTEIKSVHEPKKTKPATPVSSTWESPRYETVSEEPMTSVNRTNEIESPLDISQIQDSWREWFNRFDHVESSDTTTEVTEEKEAIKAVVEPEISTKEDTEEITIPIRAIAQPAYQPPPGELLPRNLRNLTVVEQPAPKQPPARRKTSRVALWPIQVAGVMVAMVVATLAVFGSGYFDSYVLSIKPVQIIAGVALYDR